VTSRSSSLDPDDWPAFRAAAHDLLDACIDHLSHAHEHPWRPVPEEVRRGYSVSDSRLSTEALVERLKSDILPYGTGNTHPGFFGWVHGTGLATGILSEIVAATMNSNCGGRDHGMTYLERAVVEWARSIFGFPAGASGLLLTGTSQATVLALAAARVRALGEQVRAKGQADHQLTAYAGRSAHSAIRKAMELLGMGGENLRLVDEQEHGVDIGHLRARISEDRAAGAQPFAVIGTAGSVDLGRFDDLPALADLARNEGLWFHVDGAFGAWTGLAPEPWHQLADGIEQADSLACDFHKWMYVQYDCGLLLMRSEKEHRATFALRPAYLAGQEDGLAGGDPWYCDYGTDLSRGNRALKAWAAIQVHGAEKLGEAVGRNCALAARMGSLIAARDDLKLMAPVVSNLCVFTADHRLPGDRQSRLNIAIAQTLQREGVAVFSTTDINGITALRAAITNHRTGEDDIDTAVQAVLDARGRFAR
jgi:aromatic-L-amino-acid decarboxylase